MPDPDIRLLYITTPDLDAASRIAKILVGQHLIACANILPMMQSVYRWQGAVHHADECVLLCKTRASQVASVTALVEAEHPYEVPAISSLPIDGGLPAFLQWVATESTPSTP
mgnify:CR=1 FL=1